VNVFRRKPILSGLALLALVAGLIVAVHHYRVKRATQKYRATLLAAGEKLSVKELLPPVIPGAANGAELFQAAPFFQRFFQRWGQDGVLLSNPPEAMPMQAPGHAWLRWEQSEIRDLTRGGKATNSWADVDAELWRWAAELAVLDQLAGRRALDFQLNYFAGSDLLLPHLAQMKTATQLLGYAAVAALHRGDAAKACGHLEAMLALARGSTHEYLAISQLVRFAISRITLEVTWEFIQHPEVTDAQLDRLQQGFMELDFSTSAERALEMERAMAEMMLGDMRDSRAGFDRVVGAMGPGGRATAPPIGIAEQVLQFAENRLRDTKEASLEAAWRVVWSHQDQLVMLKGNQFAIEAVREARATTNHVAALHRLEERWQEINYPFNRHEDTDQRIGLEEIDLRTLFSSVIRDFEGLNLKLLYAEARRQLVVTAIALRRYQLKFGVAPARLEELVPEFLPAVPVDPADGQPLRYRAAAAGGFTLYSVGEDGVDDGGNPTNRQPASGSLYWQDGKDWVWPKAVRTTNAAPAAQTQ
jgi:hypothetical protein